MTDITSSFTDARGFLYRDGMLDPDSAQKLTATALANCEDGELYLQYRATESFGFDDGRLKTYLANRPGSPFTRRTTAKTYKPLNC